MFSGPILYSSIVCRRMKSGAGLRTLPAATLSGRDSDSCKFDEPVARAFADQAMISESQIQTAVDLIARATESGRIILFGSHARGDAREDSDLDLLVIEPNVADRAAEMVRLRRLLRPLRIPVDVLVYSDADVSRFGDQPGSALFWALREGKVVHG